MFVRIRKQARRAKNGFALIVVIWGLGIITLLIFTFMTTARWQLQSAFNIAGATKASLLADAAINISIVNLLSERDKTPSSTPRPVHDGEPYYCALPGAEAAMVIENEAGKVDLNGAPKELLQALFIGFGVGMREADRLATAVVAFRSVPTDNQKMDTNYDASGTSLGPKHAPFETALELDQVIGVDPDLFRTLAPYVTVHSRHRGLDPEAAPPPLFAALAGFSLVDVQTIARHPFPNKLDRHDPRFPQAFKQASEGETFLVHAEILLPTGQTGLREAIVQLTSSATSARELIANATSARSGPYAVKELRRGFERYFDQLRTLRQRGVTLPAC